VYQIIIQSTLSEPLPIRNGVHQGDALACLLFNIVLEKVIRDAKINTRSSIFYKSVQTFVYADDIDIVG
jgi:sorting nexin-29